MKIVVIDALGFHTGFLGCYGNDWIATPTLDGLACDGIVFDNHLADHPSLEIEALSSARTGRFGFASTPGPDLLDLFRQRGWQVAAVRPKQLKSFAAEVLPTMDAWRPGAPALLWVDGPSLLPPWSLARDYLASYLEAEQPWPDPPQGMRKKMTREDWRRLRYTYAAAVTWFDVRLEDILAALVERGLEDELFLCVTARAGLPLGEHDLVGAGEAALHAERVQVPLILRLPGELYGGTRIPGLTQPVDLLPSLAEFLFQETIAGDGRSWWPLIREEAAEIRPFAVAALGTAPAREAYFRTPEWALTASEVPAARPSGLYLKPEDRWEVNDLGRKYLEDTERLETDLRAFLREREGIVPG